MWPKWGALSRRHDVSSGGDGCDEDFRMRRVAVDVSGSTLYSS
jgi:hypothetical protein